MCHDPSCCTSMLTLDGALKDPDLAGQARPEGVALRFKVKACLQIEPEAIRGAKIAREAERRIGRDGWARVCETSVSASRCATSLDHAEMLGRQP